MRVIAGASRGAKLRVPDEVSRPTADRVREAIFSILGERVAGARVLDLYAGSGALAIEALSRGARSAILVERNAKAAGVIEANLRSARLTGGAVERVDVERFLKREAERGRAYDLIFADPPYRKCSDDPDVVSQLLGDSVLSALLAPDGIGVMEMQAGSCEDISGDWCLLDRRIYGGTEILFLSGVKEES
jgi:16S rRNA (guanine966-N2)-methyltransferase